MIKTEMTMIEIVYRETYGHHGRNNYRYIKKLLYITMLCAFFMPSVLFGQRSNEQFSLSSPDGKLTVKVWQDAKGESFYQFFAHKQLLIDKSQLGPDTLDLSQWEDVQKRAVRTEWKPVWGKRTVVPDSYNEAIFRKHLYRFIFRVYNDGIAFRYDGVTTKRELTQFQFAGDYTAWYYNGENANLGPELLEQADGVRMPVMTIKAGAHDYMAVHEANLESGEPLLLSTQKGSKLFTITSERAKAWRVVLYGSMPGKLVDSHLIELLNPDPAPGSDFSWVKPGVAVWDWRINGAEADGFKYKMSYPSWVKMVDFAAANNIKNLVLDADWYGPEFDKSSDPLKGGKVQQVQKLIQYGKGKGVGIWLYLNDVGGKQYPLEQTIKQYGQWGATGIKYGFMNGTMEEKNKHTLLITKLCAENKLMVDFHDGPVAHYGQMRTWPNAVTREYCQAQLDARRVFQPGTFVTSVFVNMLAGPLDMNNGIMDMAQKGRVDNPMAVPSTVTAEAAKTLIVFSGATIIPDIPENYLKHPALLAFISAEQMPWKQSKTLAGEIGQYIVMARKSAQDKWLIAAATNKQSRTLSVALDMLDKGKYMATICQDGEGASYLINQESSQTKKRIVTAKDRIQIKLAKGGGACILLEKQP